MTNYVPKRSAEIARHMATKGRGLRGARAKAERLRFTGFGGLFDRRFQQRGPQLDSEIVSKYEGIRDRLKAQAGWKRHFFWTKAAERYKKSRRDLRHGHLNGEVKGLLGLSGEEDSPAPDQFQGDLNNLIDVGAGEGRRYEPGEGEEDPYGVQAAQAEEEEQEPEYQAPTSEELRERAQHWENLW